MSYSRGTDPLDRWHRRSLRDFFSLVSRRTGEGLLLFLLLLARSAGHDRSSASERAADGGWYLGRESTCMITCDVGSVYRGVYWTMHANSAQVTHLTPPGGRLRFVPQQRLGPMKHPGTRRSDVGRTCTSVQTCGCCFRHVARGVSFVPRGREGIALTRSESDRKAGRSRRPPCPA